MIRSTIAPTTRPTLLLNWLPRLAVLAGILASVVLMVRVSASAPSAAEVRMEALVSELAQDRLTASRHAAQAELEAQGTLAVPALVTALRSEQSVLRRNAADMLGFIAAPEAREAIAGVLVNDSVPAVRVNAAWALGEIGSLEAWQVLETATLKDGNALVRQTALDSLARLKTRAALRAGVDERTLGDIAAGADGKTLYASAQRDLLITRDGGQTWTALKQTLPSLATVLLVNPQDANVLYAGLDSMGLFKSANGGKTWQPINVGIEVGTGARFVVTALTADAQTPGHLLAATGLLLGTGDVTFVPQGFVESRDGGATWNKVSPYNPTEAVTRLLIEQGRLFVGVGERVVKVAAR